jgi:hypothetical protein
MFAARIGSTDNELITEVNRAGTIATFSAPRIDSNGAVSIGDLGGNARGGNSINIQANRSAVTQVASGNNSVAIGNRSTASGYFGYSTAIGYNTSASGYYGLSTAIGSNSTASGSYGTAIGLNSSSTGIGAIAIGYAPTASGSTSLSIGTSTNASGTRATVIGYYSNASGYGSTVIGNSVKTTVDNTAEIGYWSTTSARAGAIRVHSNGMVAQTTPTTDTAYLPSVLADGSEIDGTLSSGMFASRIGSTDNELITEVNRAGSIVKFSAPRIDSNGAVMVGDLGASTLGSNSITIRALGGATQVATGSNSVVLGSYSSAEGSYSSVIGNYSSASGSNSVVLGNFSSAEGNYSSVVGVYSSASGDYSSASGYNAYADGDSSTASGSYATATGDYATGIGYSSSAPADYATAVGTSAKAQGISSTTVGRNVKTTVANTTEIGYWSSSSVRAGAIRVHGTGMVAQTFQDRATEYGASAAAKGSEADNELATGMFSIRANGNDIHLDLNIGGTVKTIPLGTAA